MRRVFVPALCCLFASFGSAFDAADALASHHQHRARVRIREENGKQARLAEANSAFGRRQGAADALVDAGARGTAGKAAKRPHATVVLWMDESFWGRKCRRRRPCSACSCHTTS